MRARKSDEVLSAARHVFLERGFDSATVEEIASAAGVSKATVYSNFRDKDALLAAMIERVTSESAAILASAVEQLAESGTTRSRLLPMARSLALGVLNPEIVQLRRLAISTAVAFPVSASLYWQRGPAAAIAVLEQRFARMVEQKELTIADIPTTAAQFAYALLGPIQDRAMFEPSYVPTAGDVERYVVAAVDQLIRAYA